MPDLKRRELLESLAAVPFAAALFGLAREAKAGVIPPVAEPEPATIVPGPAAGKTITDFPEVSELIAELVAKHPHIESMRVEYDPAWGHWRTLCRNGEHWVMDRIDSGDDLLRVLPTYAEIANRTLKRSLTRYPA